MITNTESKDIQVTFANYNYAFSLFYNQYHTLCVDIPKTRSLNLISKKISAFIYNFSYSVPDKEQRVKYWHDLKYLKDEMRSDSEFKEIIRKEQENPEGEVKIEIKYYRKFYYYLLKYLNILSRFVENLTATYMPHTNIQKKLIRFSNNQMFYDKFIEYQRIVLQELSSFSIRSFMKPLNSFITFCYAYRLFINEGDKLKIDHILSLILSKLISREIIGLLTKNDLSRRDKEYLKDLDLEVYDNLLLCNSLINISFSNYGILPKIAEKVYIDRTLI